MSSLVVIGYPDEQTADAVRGKLVELSKQNLLELEDAVVVVRNKDGKAKIKQGTNLAGAGALRGSFWGLLLGTLFFMPFLGMAIGAITGAISGKFSDIGIDDSFIKQVTETIQPGNSAIFMLVRDATVDRVLEELKKFGGTVLRTNLSTTLFPYTTLFRFDRKSVV